ncbi:MAG: hypothetical protein R3270_03585 [Gammaproteobacteria bacterium]|nr:hypothetical protein [Gammaproteobacteria bacterium]
MSKARHKRVSPEELTEEKSLWQVFLVARAHSSRARLRYGLGSLFLVLAIGFYFASPALPLSTISKEFLEVFISISAALLGFLVAGISIFLAVSDSHFLKALAKTRDSNSGESHLKFLISKLLAVIVYILFALFIFLVLKLIAFIPLDLAYSLIRFLAVDKATIYHAANSLFMTSVVITFAFVVIELQAFVYNLYASVMMAMRFKIEADRRDGKDNHAN